MKKISVTLENNLADSYKLKYTSLHATTFPHPRLLTQRYKNVSTQNLYAKVHSPSIHNTPKLEILPIDHYCNRILFSSKEEQAMDTQTWINLKITILSKRSQEQNTTYCLYPSIYIKFQKMQTNP